MKFSWLLFLVCLYLKYNFMQNNLSKHILATIVYYDVMDYPMTAFEVWKYLAVISNEGCKDQEARCSLADVIKELESDELKKNIEEYRGYYFLCGRKDLVEQRIRRNKISDEKIKTVLKVVKFLRFVPFVRMVAIAGRLATKNAEKKSDLDLLIALKRGKIFTGRFLVTALVHLLGKRRYGNRITNRICLNHFITTKFSISAKDIFSSHEYAFLKPVFDNDFFMRFHKNNAWIQDYRPNFVPATDNISMIKDNHFSKTARRIGEKMLDFFWIENALKKWQKNKIAKNPQSQKAGGMIICEDEELAFWPNFENQGPAVFEKFQERLKEIAGKK